MDGVPTLWEGTPVLVGAFKPAFQLSNRSEGDIVQTEELGTQVGGLGVARDVTSSQPGPAEAGINVGAARFNEVEERCAEDVVWVCADD